MIDASFIHKKLEFLLQHLEVLEEYRDSSLEDLKEKPKDLKYVEKIIQELVDCAIDINQFILESIVSAKAWSSKQSFWDLENKVLQPKEMGFGKKDLKIFLDSVSFRNEVVHSYL